MTLLMVGLALGALLGGRAPVERWRRSLFPCGAGMSLCLALAAATPLAPSLPLVSGMDTGLDTRLLWCAGTLFMAGLFGGRYLIPVESFIQVRPPAAAKGQAIALSNFLAFLAMAVFGATFKLVGMLHPSATFVVYASAMLVFAALLRGKTAAGQGDLAAEARSPLGTVLKRLLALRYKVEESGLEGLPEQGAQPGRPGLLVLPNHPALIDPVLIYSRLAGLRPQPLIDAAQMRGFVQSRVARFLNAVLIPDLDPQSEDQPPAGRAAAKNVRQGLDMIAETLRQGHTVLLYPAGRIQRDGVERLGNAGAVARLLKAAPETRVLLVQSSGLWGSSFSRASGASPRFMPALGRGWRTLLGNLLVFTPRRQVRITFSEPADLPRDGDKRALNRYLESFYNQGQNGEAQPVRRFFWSPKPDATGFGKGG
jgi:1-acyl-sn-glycerol-3-phosphate acyltransferase